MPKKTKIKPEKGYPTTAGDESRSLVTELRIFTQWLRKSDNTRCMMWSSKHRCFELADPEELLKAYLRDQGITK
jgi:hypothetical protein